MDKDRQALIKILDTATKKLDEEIEFVKSKEQEELGRADDNNNVEEVEEICSYLDEMISKLDEQILEKSYLLLKTTKGVFNESNEKRLAEGIGLSANKLKKEIKKDELYSELFSTTPSTLEEFSRAVSDWQAY